MRYGTRWWSVWLGVGLAGSIGPAALGATVAATVAQEAQAAPPVQPSFVSPTDQFVRRVLALSDHRQQAFAVVDKQAALLTVFDADGQRLGATSVLLGQDIGDETVPGVGDRTQSGQLRSGDRTTPAGRFASEPGRNLAGESIVWVDYDAAFAIHRLRPGASAADRARRLASTDPRDKRVSAGCVVVPEAFFQGVVQPALGLRHSVVYVLPERGAWQSLWPQAAAN